MGQERPRFGAGSRQPEARRENFIEEVEAQTKETRRSRKNNLHFGPQPANKVLAPSVFERIWQVFSLQEGKFWLISYGLSLILLVFFSSHLFFLVKLLNFLLFPFAVILIGQFSLFLPDSVSPLRAWLNFNSQPPAGAMLFRLFFYGTQILFFSLLWQVSLVLGLAGCGLAFLTSTKVNK